MDVEFLDFASKAKEIGVSEAVIRARVLSGGLQPFAYVYGAWVYADQHNFLPARTSQEFPFLRWKDHGSVIDSDEIDFGRQHSVPRYTITGWVGLSRKAAEEIVVSGKRSIGGTFIFAFDGAFEKKIPLFVKDDVVFDTQVIEASHLYIPAQPQQTGTPSLSPRREANLMRIIAALHALLRDEQGGGFPSQAKIIDILSERFEGEEGLGKRNLETVFAEANRLFQAKRQ